MRAREKIWVVRPGEGTTVGEVLRHAGDHLVPAREGDAVAAGRVFVGRRRVNDPKEAVKVGDTIRVGALAPVTITAGEARGRTPEVSILFTQDDLAFVVKPAGLSTVPDHAGARSLVTLASTALGTNVEHLRVTSRLDHDVSGVVVFALSDEAATRLREARSLGRYQRRYVALAYAGGAPSSKLEERGVWTAAIGRAANPRLRAAAAQDDEREAKDAATRFACVARIGLGDASSSGVTVGMLAVDPVTGRTHQIRVHAMNAGAPLVGDRDYGGPGRITLPSGRVIALARVALHAARVVVPGRTGPLEGRAPIPEELLDVWTALGGEREAWDRAVSCETPPFEP